jgi:hypothetical protein
MTLPAGELPAGRARRFGDQHRGAEEAAPPGIGTPRPIPRRWTGCPCTSSYCASQRHLGVEQQKKMRR